MNNAPVMRVRGHGVQITFEFGGGDDEQINLALESIRRFCAEMAGERSSLRINNLATGKTVQSSLADIAGTDDLLTVVLPQPKMTDGIRN